MDTGSLTPEYHLRPATPADAARIRRIISLVHINPTALDWHRFILAVDQAGSVIGCGQVKPHTGGLQELASLASRNADHNLNWCFHRHRGTNAND